MQSSLGEQRRVTDNCLTAFGKTKSKEQVVVIMGEVLSARVEALSEDFSFLSWCKILAWSLKSGSACSKNEICQEQLPFPKLHVDLLLHIATCSS